MSKLEGMCLAGHVVSSGATWCCNLPKGHTGLHDDGLGDQWEDADRGKSAPKADGRVQGRRQHVNPHTINICPVDPDGEHCPCQRDGDACCGCSGDYNPFCHRAPAVEEIA